MQPGRDSFQTICCRHNMSSISKHIVTQANVCFLSTYRPFTQCIPALNITQPRVTPVRNSENLGKDVTFMPWAYPLASGS